jgi:hypothetical protein
MLIWHLYGGTHENHETFVTVVCVGAGFQQNLSHVHYTTQPVAAAPGCSPIQATYSIVLITFIAGETGM